MICKSCGKEIAPGTKFCMSCGAPAPEQTQSYQQPQYNAPPQPQYTAPQQPYGAPQQPYYGAPQQPYGAPQQPYYGAPQQAGFAPAPITKRNIVTCILLSIVTCGIYGLYWFVCMVNDLNTASRSQNATSGGMVFLLSLITCGIYMIYWLFKAGDQVAAAKRFATGQNVSGQGILYLLLSIFGLGIVVYCLIQNELNQVAAY